MALGKRRQSGEILPIFKWDAVEGKAIAQTRVNHGFGWETETNDVTGLLTERGALFDLQNTLVGWAEFAKGKAPDVRLVPAGEDFGPQPSPEHKECVRLLVKFDDDKDRVRELLSSSLAVWNAVDALHDQFLAVSADHAGEVPRVVIANIQEVKTSNGNLTMADDQMTVEQWLAIRKEAGLHIDPETAEVLWTYEQVADPYGVHPDLPEEYQCVGRAYFARSPGSDVWVEFGDLPDATRDALWEKHKSKLAFHIRLRRQSPP
jgi:hypothetical protein